jgi:LysM repeat protein/murein endopeptidase
MHRLPRVLGLWCLLVFAAGVLGWVPEAAAAGSSKKSSKKKPKKKASKKKKAPEKVKPVQRDAEGPQAVSDSGELEEGEGDEEEDVGDTEAIADPEAELEAIERELLAQPPVEDPMVGPPAVPVPPPRPVNTEPQWVRHEVIPGETLEEIAGRYKVEVSLIKLWNHIKKPKPGAKEKPLQAGRTLRVRAVNPPPARESFEVKALKGDTWASLAKQHGVDEASLRRWNRKYGGKLTAGKTKLTVWREGTPDPAAPVGDGLAAKLASIKVRAGGISIGRPARGRLVRGVELPDRPDLYSRRKPEEAYGSTHAITQLLVAITRFRHETGFKRTISIGGISKARGGRFRPHKSHQSGRDIDIRMPLLASSEGKKNTTSGDVDWKLTWRLMHAFIASGEVEYIFLDHGLQKKLYKAAREVGATKEELAGWIQWPNKAKTNKGVVRHVKGHRVHFHVRIRCAPHEKHCVTVR